MGQERSDPGLEGLLAMAAVDERFAAALLADRERTIEASGVSLTPTEQRLLRSIDDAALRSMVAGVGSTIPDHERRRFVGVSAAAALALFAGACRPSCEPSGRSSRSNQLETGSRPHRKPEPVTGTRPTPTSPPDSTGIRPDLPPGGGTGIRPDRPAGIRPDAGGTVRTGSRPDRPGER